MKKAENTWLTKSKYKKEKKRINSNKINVVFNYSSVTLSKDMEKVLNRGFNFAILSPKLDITQMLVDFKRFERSMIWQEYWFDNENANDAKNEVIFKTKKDNLPKNYKSPKELTTFLGAVKSELMDPKNRNKTERNLPESEFEALKELVKLQKERKIVIKPCDKGAGIMILNFEDYLETCNMHLSSEDGGNPFYKKVNEYAIEEAKNKIKEVLKEAYDNDIITKREFEAMDPETKGVGRFYCTFKVHKEHEEGKPPPERPIVSGNESFTENIGSYIDHHIKELGQKHDTYLQDTPDFLRNIEKINADTTLPDNTILVTLDVKSLYTVIPQSEGVECVEDALSEREEKDVPSAFIARLLELLLKYNIFEFNGDFFQQIIGTAMGSKPAPPYANIFMSRKIDNPILKIAEMFRKNNKLSILFFKRFLDDLFLICTGNTKYLHTFLHEINQIHPSIKLTMTHTSIRNESSDFKCNCPEQYSISFLDTLCEIKSGKIITDLYRKPTDRNQYLLTSSCHPIQCTKSIPFSLCMRIQRICSEPEAREQRFAELKELLLSREYPQNIINSAIKRARAIPRHEALKKVVQTKSERRPIFVVTFDPRLPAIPPIQQKHWRSMVNQDQYMKRVFPLPPLTAYKRQKNVKDFVVKARVAPKEGNSRRVVKGMRKCGKCSICPYIREGKSVKINQFSWKISKSVDCNSSNIVYAIQCNKDNCRQSYVGESGRSLRQRFLNHKGYVENQTRSQATGFHFNLPGHSKNNLTITIIEQVRKVDPCYRKEREKFFINKFNTFHNGINKMP